MDCGRLTVRSSSGMWSSSSSSSNKSGHKFLILTGSPDFSDEKDLALCLLLNAFLCEHVDWVQAVCQHLGVVVCEVTAALAGQFSVFCPLTAQLD